MKQQISAFYYCAGRGDGADDYDDLEADADALALQVVRGADLHSTVAKAVDAGLAIDSFSTKRADWEEDFADDIAEHELDGKGGSDDAYKEWRRGRRDELIAQLSDDVVEIIEDLVDDDSDDDDDEDDDREPSVPGARRHAAGDPNAEYARFETQGVEDGNNVFDLGEAADLAVEECAAAIALGKSEKYMANHARKVAFELISDELPAKEWKSQTELDGAKLGPAYDAWRDGWVFTAQELLRKRAAEQTAS